MEQPFHLMNNVLKKLDFFLETVRKPHKFSCRSFLTYPVVSLIHTMKCAVLQVAFRPIS